MFLIFLYIVSKWGNYSFSSLLVSPEMVAQALGIISIKSSSLPIRILNVSPTNLNQMEKLDFATASTHFSNYSTMSSAATVSKMNQYWYLIPIKTYLKPEHLKKKKHDIAHGNPLILLENY